MYQTEDEAKTKICPPSLMSGGSNKCQTTECMAWRWAKKPTETEPGTGYCGLAGDPRVGAR